MYSELKTAIRCVGNDVMKCREQGITEGQWIGTQYKAEADLIANEILTKKLKKILDIPIISEEDNLSHCEERPHKYWLIDPIDGTASYAEGFSGFVCQAALMEFKQPQMAAVYAPAQDKLYMAYRGKGATVNGLRINVREFSRKNLIIVDNFPQPRGIASIVFHGLHCKQYLESGSIGLKICLVAEGLADIFVKNVPVKDWDLAAPHLILEEAGGKLTLISGKEINYKGSYKKNGLIAVSSSALLSDILNTVSETG